MKFILFLWTYWTFLNHVAAKPHHSVPHLCPDMWSFYLEQEWGKKKKTMSPRPLHRECSPKEATLGPSTSPFSSSELNSHPCSYISRNKTAHLFTCWAKGLITQEREVSLTEINTDEALKKAGRLHRIRYWSLLFSQLLLCSPPAEDTSNLLLTSNETRKLNPEQTQCMTTAGHEGIPSTRVQKTMNTGNRDTQPTSNTAWQLRTEWRINTGLTEPGEKPRVDTWPVTPWDVQRKLEGQGIQVNVYQTPMKEI